MTAAFATLAFLVAIWTVVVVAATVYDRAASRIVAALKGRSTQPVALAAPVRIRHQRYHTARPARVTMRQRAAA